MIELETVEDWGYTVKMSVKKDGESWLEKLKVSPWSQLKPEHLDFIEQNKTQIYNQLRQRKKFANEKRGSMPDIFEKDTDKRTKRIDSDCAVITSTTGNRDAWTRFSCWFCFFNNDVEYVVYNNGGALFKEMFFWGAQEVIGKFNSNIDCILDALEEYDKVLWVDPSVVINCDVSEIFEKIEQQVFIPSYSFKKDPHASVLGVKANRDEGFLEQLRQAGQQKIKDIVDFKIQDGEVWNKRIELYEPSVEEVCNYIFREGAKIYNNYEYSYHQNWEHKKLWPPSKVARI
tara:strand:- start:11867 stop:12730 length:864 start_codon:yes stop_codon:yes gene_type:complete